MATKNISISEEAYQRLKALRKPGESFTEVIERITRNMSAPELSGVLSRAEGIELKNTIRKIRAQDTNRIRGTTERLR